MLFVAYGWRIVTHIKVTKLDWFTSQYFKMFRFFEYCCKSKGNEREGRHTERHTHTIQKIKRNSSIENG